MICPAVHFPGCCAEAMELYKKAFNASVNYLLHVKDAPRDAGSEAPIKNGNRVAHAEMTICGSRVNMSDCDDAAPGSMVLLNAFMPTSDEVAGAYAVLKDGGKVIIELGPTFFSPMYCSVEDRFGVRWQLIGGK